MAKYAKEPELGLVKLADLQRPALELASRFIDESRRRDENYPDLDLVVSSKAEGKPLVADLRARQQNAATLPFSYTSQALPGELYSLISAPNVQYNMGVFAPINRVWVAQGKRLFFWAYGTGNAETVQNFDEMPANIVSVDLVPPRKDVFIETVNWLLLISTAEHMYFYALSTTDNDLQVFDTGLSVPLGTGAPLVKADPSTGRIFFAGANTGTSLWEAYYSNTESWLRNKTGKVCHSGQGLPMLSSVFGTPAPKPGAEKTIDMQIDESRSLIYTLSSKSTVRIYSFRGASGGVSYEQKYTVAQVQHHLNVSAQLNSDKPPGQPVEPIKDLQLVSISVIPRQQSSFARLVAVTTTGHRVYFRCDNFARDPTRTFQAVYYKRGPDLPVKPQPAPPAANGQASTPAGASAPPLTPAPAPAPVTIPVDPPSRVIDGTTLVVGANETLYLHTIDATRVFHHVDIESRPVFAELAAKLKIDGPLYHVSMTSPSAAQRTRDHRGFDNPCAQQYTERPQQLVILTTKAIYTIRQRSFYERMEESVLPAYGPVEVCCAALATATRPSSFVTKQQREQAVAVFFRFGGLPVFQKNFEAARNPLIADPKAAIGREARERPSEPSGPQQLSILLSALVDGLAVYTERLLLPLWAKKIVGVGADQSISISVSREILETAHSDLTGLTSLLQNNRAFSDGMGSRPAYAQQLYVGDVSVLSQAEHTSLNALSQLVKSCQQGIAFLLLILSESSNTPKGLATLLGYFSATNLEKFKVMTFRDFFGEAKNSDVTRELVSCLVNFVINRGDSVESVAQTLQERCESYCSANDVLVYRALEYLHAAKNIPPTTKGADSDARMRNLYQSVALFKRAAATVQLDTLKDVVSEYIQFGFYSGAVEVILAVAAGVDPSNAALSYVREGKPANDVREAVYRQKHEFYQLVFEVLSKADAASEQVTQRIIVENKDEVFHFAFYDWLLASNQADRIAGLTSPFVLPWLQSSASRNLEVAELLWKYHQKNGDLLAAADVLLELARGELPVAMSQRVEFLSRAMGYCSCTFPPGMRQQVAKLSTMVQSYLQIAMIQSDILTEVEKDPHLGPAVKEQAITALNQKLLSITELFNDYADPLGYYAICLAIFDVADFRDPVEVRRAWQNLLDRTRMNDEIEQNMHYSHVGTLVTNLGRRYLHSEFVFPVDELVPMLEQYAFEHTPGSPRGWAALAFVNAGVSCAVVYGLLMALLKQGNYPFNYEDAARVLANDIDYLIEEWTARDQWEVSRVVTEDDRALIRKHLV